MKKRKEEIAANPDYVEEVLKKGAEKASAVAEETMKEVREIVGLR
jgi:tryptophanyl-tRNA synthetase